MFMLDYLWYRYMFDNFFKHIDIEPSNVHILDGNAKDLKAECNNYEKKITDAGGIELFVGKYIFDVYLFKPTHRKIGYNIWDTYCIIT